MESLETLEENRDSAAETSDTESGRRDLLRRLGIGAFAVCAFFLFLMWKLPEARIQNYVIAHLRIASQDQGFLFSAEKVKIGMIFGPAIKLYNIELKSIDDNTQKLKIPYLRVRPHLLSLIGSTKKATISAELLDGGLSGTVGAGPTAVVADLDLDKLNLGATSLLKQFLPVAVAGIIDGEIKLDLDLTEANKSSGKIALKIQKLSMPPQSVYGFNLPKINVADSKIDITINQGQLLIRSFEIGKDIKTDDIVGQITGDGTLDRVLMRSRLNAKATLDVSQSVKQALPLLEALLQPAKTSDGKYTYHLTGPLMSIEARPGQ